MRGTSGARLPAMLVVALLCQALPGCGDSGTGGKSNSVRVTKGNFDKITVGMSEAEVSSILGEPGNSTSASVSKTGTDGVTTSSSSSEKAWGDTKKSIKVTFADGKVVSKFQEGL